ncbi:MAG: hypothetical protein RL664_1882 [Bacteroidota bacterium]
MLRTKIQLQASNSSVWAIFTNSDSEKNFILSIMTESKTKNDNYIGYLILELLLTGIFTFLVTALGIFYGSLKSDVKNDSDLLLDLLGDPLSYTLICLVPSLVAILFLLFYRNVNYIIGFEFNESEQFLTLRYRRLFRKETNDIQIPYFKISTIPLKEKKIFFNFSNKGMRFSVPNSTLKLDFVSNNFIWEYQPRSRVYFLEELERIENNQSNLNTKTEFKL